MRSAAKNFKGKSWFLFDFQSMLMTSLDIQVSNHILDQSEEQPANTLLMNSPPHASTEAQASSTPNGPTAVTNGFASVTPASAAAAADASGNSATSQASAMASSKTITTTATAKATATSTAQAATPAITESSEDTTLMEPTMDPTTTPSLAEGAGAWLVNLDKYLARDLGAEWLALIRLFFEHERLAGFPLS